MRKLIRIFGLLSLIFLMSNFLLARDRIVIESKLFKGFKVKGKSAPEVIIASYTEPFFAFVGPSNIEAESKSISNLKDELNSIYQLKHVDHLTSGNMIWDGKKEFLNETILYEEFSYPIHFSPKMLSKSKVNLRIEMFKIKGTEVPINEVRGEKLIDTEIILNFNEPVILGFPSNGHTYFLSIFITKRKTSGVINGKISKVKSKLNLSQPPRPVHKVKPLYPKKCKENKIEGSVILELTTDKEGNVSKVRVIKSAHPDLENAAKQALKEWKYEPVFKKGKAVSAMFAVSVDYKFTQELAHESLVINVEVPVRVFKGSKFIDNLTIDDFEVYEDGKLQKLEAVYLIKKKSVERKEEKKKFTPDTSRTFYLFFEITEYSPRINDALRYFIQNVLMPGDNLFIVTPMRTYDMHPEALELKSTEEIVNEFRRLLRKDAMVGSMEYRSSITELTRLTRTFAAALFPGDQEYKRLHPEIASEYLALLDKSDPALFLQILVTAYRNLLERLDSLKHIDQSKLLDFAESLKGKEGQKYVFMFYQREFIPQIEPTLLAQIGSLYQSHHDVIQSLTDIFQSYKREITFDVNRIKHAFADASTPIHFMFFTKPAEHIPGLRLEEHSEHIYAAFREIAQATGGITESSSNPNFLFKKAVESSENYYLLYYAPLNYKRDGKFRNIKVRVKNLNCRVIHRAGYFANGMEVFSKYF